MLVKEKGRRLKGMLDEEDAKEEGNEPERAKFKEMVEAKRREKISANISYVVDCLLLGKAIESKKGVDDESLKAEQSVAFEKLLPQAQTILDKYLTQNNLQLSALHTRVLSRVVIDGERKLDPAVEAEIRTALMNNETIARESEEEVRSEVEGAVTAIEASSESVEAKKAAVLGLLNTKWESANKELAGKAKTRKDVMKLTAVAVALIGGYLVSKFSGQEAGATGAKPSGPGGTGGAGPGGAGGGNADGPFKPWSTIPDPKEAGDGPFQPWSTIPDHVEGGPLGPDFLVRGDAFKAGEGVIRFAERVANGHPELFKGMSDAQIEKWSIDLLLQKGLITIDKARGLVNYKFIPHPGDTARIISDAAGKPIDFEFMKGVSVSGKTLMSIPFEKSDLAGRSIADLARVATESRPGDLVDGIINPEFTARAAARVAERVAEARRIRESLGGADLKYLWQFWKPDPDAILPKEEPLQWGL